MRLSNPPIVEAWIEFHFHGSDMEETWPVGLDPFFRELVTEYSTIERQVAESYQVVERAPGGAPVQIAIQGEIRRVRAFDAPRRKCVQVSRDTLVVNLIKGNEPYEGFRLLLPAAMDHLGRYVRIFRPRSVLVAALHYTDVVRIPRTPGGSARLEDHFRLGVQVPDDASWLLGRISIEITLRLSPDTPNPDELILGFRREPTSPGADEDRFRMDWHAVCPALETLSNDILSARLTQAHEALKRRFRDCFTDRTWAMFGEETET